MNLKRREKIELLNFLNKLSEIGLKFKAIYNEELDELYEEYLDGMDGESGNFSEYEEKYKEDENGEEILHLFEDCREIVKKIFSFVDKEDIDLLETSMGLIQALKENIQKREIDIFAEIPALSLKTVLSFDDAIKLNGLVMHLMAIGKKLENEFEKEEDKGKKDIIAKECLSVLKKDEDILRMEIDNSDSMCPVDLKMLHIYNQALEVVNNYIACIKGEENSAVLDFSIEELKRNFIPLQEMLAGYDKELKLVGLINYLLETGGKLKHIHATMDGEEAEKAIDKLYKFLEDDLKKLEGERNRYSIHDSSEHMAIEALTLCREVVEHYMEAIESNDIGPVNESYSSVMKAGEMVNKYRETREKSRETGIAQYLIKAGKDLKILYKSKLEKNDIELRMENMLQQFLKDLEKMEKEKKKYFKVEEEDENAVIETAFALQPVDNNMAKIYDKGIEALNNYVEFIEENRDISLIDNAFRDATYIAYMLEETNSMVDDMQGSSTQAGTILGEA